MKIIIVHASAGAGHRKAAEALYNYIKQTTPQIELSIIDILEKTNPLFKNIYVYGYLFLVNHAKWLWGFLFWLTSIKAFEKINSFLSFLIDKPNTRKFANLLIKEQPDIIISTHFLPPEIAGYLKKQGKIKSKLVSVITDFGVHPYWLSETTELYTVASSFTKDQLLKDGVEEGKIIVTGIPVDPKFVLNYDKAEICEKLNIDKDKFIVLITTGSFGLGPVEKIAKLLCRDVQVLVVCASNKKLYQNLTAKNYPNVLVMGFIDNIHEVMAISNLVIAKPGGLTTSEMLCMELVPIFVSPIPGQEMYNIRALQSFGIGVFSKSARQIYNLVLGFKSHPERINEAKTIIRNIKKPQAAESIYNAIR